MKYCSRPQAIANNAANSSEELQNQLPRRNDAIGERMIKQEEDPFEDVD